MRCSMPVRAGQVHCDLQAQKTVRSERTVLIRGNLVEHVQQRAADEAAEPVVRDDAEERHNLLDVVVDLPPHCIQLEIVVAGVSLHRFRYFIVGEKFVVDPRLAGKLEPIDSRAALPHGADRTSVDPSAQTIKDHSTQVCECGAAAARSHKMFALPAFRRYRMQSLVQSPPGP